LRVNNFYKIKYIIFVLIFIFCNNPSVPEEEFEETNDIISEFIPVTTIKSVYDNMPEGDKKSYKLRKYWIQNILKDIKEMTEEEKKISYDEANNPNPYAHLDDGTDCSLDLGGLIHGTLIDENYQLDFSKIDSNRWTNRLENMQDSLFNDGYQITLEVSYNCLKDEKSIWLYGPLFYQDGQWWSFTDTDRIDFPEGEGNYWRQSTRVKVNLGSRN